MERLARLIQQEDIEAWGWFDRAALLQILTDSVARSQKLRERNESEREIRMDLSSSKCSPEHAWTRTGSALLGVDRHPGTGFRHQHAFCVYAPQQWRMASNNDMNHLLTVAR